MDHLWASQPHVTSSYLPPNRSRAANTPCTCNYVRRNIFPDIPTQGSVSFEEVLGLDQQIHCLLDTINACKRCASELSTVLGILRALDQLLLVFKAAQTTYYQTERPDRSQGNSQLQPTSSLSPGARDTTSLICTKSCFSLGGMMLGESESDIMAKKMISEGVSRIGGYVKRTQQRIAQERASYDHGNSRQMTTEYEEVDRAIASTLAHVWAAVAHGKM